MHARLATAHDVDAIRAANLPAGGPAMERAIAAGACHVAEEAGMIAGYAVHTKSFFGRPFVELLIVAEAQHRRGVGTTLMLHIEALCTEEKLFTSTNESNAPMQALCERLGYVRSGYIENLDEGDPEIIYVKRVRPAEVGRRQH